MDTPPYFDAFPDFALDRGPNGVLTLRLHSNGAPASLSSRLHRDLARVLREIADDRDNRVLVLTGTGDRFMTDMDLSEDSQAFKPLNWDMIFWEGRQALRALVDLPMPIVAAINGPATIHSEWVLLGDITIAADTAHFQDLPHLAGEVVPSDGIHVVWEEILGINRARYAALTQQVIQAEEALRLGMVNEVLPHAEVLPRALELAASLAARPALLLRLTPLALRQRLARRLEEGTNLGLALEGLSMADKPYQGEQDAAAGDLGSAPSTSRTSGRSTGSRAGADRPDTVGGIR
ncbi:enoyl-CoA hydratase/isomerase family protein [Streptomyces sp. NBC_01239]|uniref:enoyl-CoA hydratase/isomerase family protein n=1 Tax=Streptomyces sp. NBC_01239 TaxID=2903792 RepID=UPI002259B663|nr:enoyl-CoA hydratase/isomerase family protein [Streptomyces sp. NBC_01239]MCX4815166.1 enoyl-CoA hydratase/isomerase family protein [Streptomyces sp. NBC_01239]